VTEAAALASSVSTSSAAAPVERGGHQFRGRRASSAAAQVECGAHQLRGARRDASPDRSFLVPTATKEITTRTRTFGSFQSVVDFAWRSGREVAILPPAKMTTRASDPTVNPLPAGSKTSSPAMGDPDGRPRLG
jgi:hypothetical protein